MQKTIESMVGYIFTYSDSNISFLSHSVLIMCISILIYYLTFKIIVHEVGHLIFGLLAGNRFKTLRIGCIMLIKVNGHYRLTWHKSYGSDGQCILIPPDNYRDRYTDNYIDKRTFALYMLGGIILDVVLSTIYLFLGLFPSFLSNPVRIVLLSLALTDFLSAITNGAVIKGSTINNDGTITYYLLTDKYAARSFYSNCKVFEQLLNGKSYKDISMEYYMTPDGADLKNTLIASQKINCSYYYMDTGQWDKALECLTEIENAGGKHSSDIYYQILWEKLFLYIKTNRCTSEIEALYNHVKLALQKYKSDINCIRVRLSYELYQDTSYNNKKRIMNEIKTKAKKYPYEGEANFCIHLLRGMID